MRNNSAISAADGVRGRALAAAARLLAEHGAAALSLRGIAEAAGIGPASIYHYFAGKDALLVSLALEGYEQLRRELLAWPDSEPPMRFAAQAFFAFVRARPTLFSLMFSEGLLSRHDDLRQAEQKIVQAYLAAVKADHRIPPAHQENAAHAIWALGRGMASIIASYPAAGPPPELLEKLFAGGRYLIDHPE